MEKIKFNVSSKTARLIGRENISDSNGAIIELVKNAYDADADSVYIQFNILFENIPNSFLLSENEKYFSKEEYKFLLSCYEQKGDILEKKKNISQELEIQLQNLLFSKNTIIIIDNGIGMDENIIKTVWMNIGTNDKEINTYSPKGRIKTGAKGIGRFALEKLSQITTVYSQKKDGRLVYWNLDWKQFDDKSLLDEINANINIMDLSFLDVVSQYVDYDELKSKNISFNSGTMIILSGTREIWGDRIYKRINNNLESINPFGNVDTFNVYVNNLIKSEYNYLPQNNFMSEDDYDYIIEASYDGNETVNIRLTRNEIDLLSKEEHVFINGKEYIFDIEDFWKRDAFKNSPYKKEDYSSTITNNYNILNLIKFATLEELKKIGKFDLQLYFLKSGKSEFDIIKDIKVNRRKKLLTSFSGIKIYRDNFKVRPYGEDGPMYDWLGLGSRVQNSPAGVTHPTGSWRVNTYQIIGNVNISRIDNPNLQDMANREGLTLNDTYFLFVDLIKEIISKFEFDRQYIYREYGSWLKKLESEISVISVIEKSVLDEVNSDNKGEVEFSDKEYREAIYKNLKEKEQSIDTQRILMNFSSVGVAANTFAHEMKGIATNLSTRNEQLKICINNLLGNKEYNGPKFLNPYSSIENGEKNDVLLSKWLKLIMDSVDRVSSEKSQISLLDFFKEFSSDWKGLLEQKSINLNINDGTDYDCLVNCEKTDLYLVFNNLILNSAFFLEQEVNGEERLINILFSENENYINFIVFNNGPTIAEKYISTPDVIFEPGETTKEKGTGLGLWICRDAVQRNHGEIHAVPVDNGFKIEIKWPKGG